MPKPVGFDQKILLTQLNFTANELRFTAKKGMYAQLDEYLHVDFQGDKARKNAITLLMKIWCLVEPEHQGLQSAALRIFPESSAEEKLLLHWGMILLAYPFFQAVAGEMGNLLRLQGEAPSQQLGRRIKLHYGDRRRVEVALTAVLSSLKAWGVVERGVKNVYTVPHKIEVQDVQLKNWILAVILHASEYRAMPLAMLTSQDFFFPFTLEMSVAEIDSQKFQIDRQGLDTCMISLVK